MVLCPLSHGSMTAKLVQGRAFPERPFGHLNTAPGRLLSCRLGTRIRPPGHPFRGLPQASEGCPRGSVGECSQLTNTYEPSASSESANSTCYAGRPSDDVSGKMGKPLACHGSAKPHIEFPFFFRSGSCERYWLWVSVLAIRSLGRLFPSNQDNTPPRWKID